MGKLANPYRVGTVYHNIAQEKPLLYQYQYIMEIVGGGTFYIDDNFRQFTLFDKDDANPDTCFAYWVKGQVAIPAFDIKSATAKFYSMKFNIPACRTYGHDLSLTLMTDQDLTFYKKLDTWLQLISRLNIDGGGLKTIPTIKMRLLLLNSQHDKFIDSFVFEGCWINSLGGLNFEYTEGQSKLMDLTATFKYQYAYRDPEFDLANDPLGTARILAAAGTI